MICYLGTFLVPDNGTRCPAVERISYQSNVDVYYKHSLVKNRDESSIGLSMRTKELVKNSHSENRSDLICVVWYRGPEYVPNGGTYLETTIISRVLSQNDVLGTDFRRSRGYLAIELEITERIATDPGVRGGL